MNSKFFLFFLFLETISGQKDGIRYQMFDITNDLEDIPIDPEEPPQQEEAVLPHEQVVEVTSSPSIDPQQPANDFKQEPKFEHSKEGPCDKPGSKLKMTLGDLCSLPPEKGRGYDDVFRYYFNPVLQMCVPFSYSGKGGNANRFVSVKNCYEICHPADPSVKKPRVVSGIRAYLTPKTTQCDDKSQKQEKQQERTNEYVLRQIPHPLDPRKTLTIVQSTKYIRRPNQLAFAHPDPSVRKLYQYETRDQYVDPRGRGYGHPVFEPIGSEERDCNLSQ